MKIYLKQLIISILIPLAAGGLSTIFTAGNMENFENVNKPMFSPPGIVFPIVWTVLYILMGIASYLIYTSKTDAFTKRNALTVYGVQLFFNFMWSIIFFNFEAYLFAFIWLILLLCLVTATFVLFFRIKKSAAYLLIPYIIWLIVAGYLNLGVYILN